MRQSSALPTVAFWVPAGGADGLRLWCRACVARVAWSAVWAGLAEFALFEPRFERVRVVNNLTATGCDLVGVLRQLAQDAKANLAPAGHLQQAALDMRALCMDGLNCVFVLVVHLFAP
jgi:hypothetical protein